jgi:hypothetical protein
VWLGSRVELAGVLVVKPTSLTRGEGLVICLLCVVERGEGSGVLRRDGGGGGTREDKPISTVMRLM